jgi:phosphoribosylglycinamide formyltransferase-1
MFRFTIWTSGDRDALELTERIYIAVQDDTIPGSAITALACNRIRGEDPESDVFLDWCDDQDLPAISVSSQRLRRSSPDGWREELGRRFRLLLGPFSAEVHVLVGYMLWVDDATAAGLRLLNLHPALPGGPRGTWQQVIRAIQSAGAEEHGATMQLVLPGQTNRDQGIPVTYFRFPITPPMSFEEIRTLGFQREPTLLVETLKTLARRDLRLGENRARDLTDEVDRSLRAAT